VFQAERLYIESNTQSSKGNLQAPPFKSILRSVPFWAMVVTFFGYSWGFFTLISEIPTYLNNIQHIPLSSVSLKHSSIELIKQKKTNQFHAFRQALCYFFESHVNNHPLIIYQPRGQRVTRFLSKKYFGTFWKK
jgi:hypothetical protein